MSSTANDGARPLWGIEPSIQTEAGKPGAPAAVPAAPPGRWPGRDTRWLLLGQLAMLLILGGLVLAFRPAAPAAAPATDPETREVLHWTSDSLGDARKQLGALADQLGKLDSRLRAVEGKLPKGGGATADDVQSVKKSLGDAREDIKDATKTIDQLTKMTAALADEVSRVSPTLGQFAARADRTDGKIEQVVNSAATRAAADAVKGMKGKGAGTADKATIEQAVKESADKVAGEFRDILDTKLQGPLSGLQKEVDALKTALASLTGQLRRDNDVLDVALVLYHTKKIDANPYRDQVRELARQLPAPNRPGHDLAIFVATESQVHHVVRPFGNRGPVRFDRMTRLESNTEAPSNLSPKELFENRVPQHLWALEWGGPIFDRSVARTAAGAAARATIPWHRRCVFVVTTGCTPPRDDNAAWNGIAVDAVLLDMPGADREKNLKRWQDFCQAHRGVAVALAPRDEDTQPDTDTVMRYVRRFVSPP